MIPLCNMETAISFRVWINLLYGSCRCCSITFYHIIAANMSFFFFVESKDRGFNPIVTLTTLQLIAPRHSQTE